MEYWVAGIVGLVVTFLATPLVARLMRRRGVIDIPNERSSHVAHIPRGGGIACALGIIAGSAAAMAAGAEIAWAALIFAFLLATLGLLDDVFRLPPIPRLLTQLALGGALGYTVGGMAGAALGAGITALLVNVVNFMDGVNGITALTLAVWGSVALVASLQARASTVVVLAALTLAAALGFLPWNAPRATVFLGDVGSYLFGSLAAAGILIGAAAGLDPKVLAAPFSVYLLDTGSAIVRRAGRRENLLVPHRDHIYQRLASEVGLPHAAVALWAASLALGISLAWATFTALAAAIVTSTVLTLYFFSTPLATRVFHPAPERAAFPPS